VRRRAGAPPAARCSRQSPPPAAAALPAARPSTPPGHLRGLWAAVVARAGGRRSRPPQQLAAASSQRRRPPGQHPRRPNASPQQAVSSDSSSVEGCNSVPFKGPPLRTPCRLGRRAAAWCRPARDHRAATARGSSIEEGAAITAHPSTRGKETEADQSCRHLTARKVGARRTPHRA
jgi:hypothetical protein